MLPTPTTARASRLRDSKNAWWIALSARTCCDRVDHARDVALGCALRDRVDVDVVPAERVEQLARDARPAFHALADDGENRLVRACDRAIISWSSTSWRNSCSIASTPRAASPLRTAKQIVCSEDAWEIRMTLTCFAASVRNSRSAIARHADHARPAQRQQRQAVDRRDALGQRVVGLAAPCSK